MQSLDPQLAGFKQRLDGAYIINMRDDIWMIKGYYPNQETKFFNLCTDCLGHLILNHGFQIVPIESPLHRRYVCERCKSINRKHLITLVGIDYCQIIDLIQQGNGTYIRSDGVVFHLIDLELSSK